MRYSIEHRDRIYVKGYGFLFFAKNMGKNLSNKYGQEFLDSAKKIYNKAKSSAKHSVELHSKNHDVNNEIGAPKRRYISPEERQQIIHESRLV